MGELFRRLHYLLNRRRFDRELCEEMAAHRENAGGHFGNALRLREEARDAWGWTWLDRLAQDLRYAFRKLCRAPGFTLAAILMLAIGIGANVAAFGFFNILLLKPLPIREPQSILRFQRRSPDQFAHSVPYPEFAFFRDHSKTLSAFLALSPARLTIEGEEKPLNAHCVTANFFTELGTIPTLGSLFDAARDGVPAAAPVVVLADGFWRRHFAADPTIAGKTIRLNGKPATVLGVAASGFSGLSLDKADIWLPIQQQPYFVAGSQLLTDFSPEGTGAQFWARLRQGVVPKAAERELALLAAQLRKQYPNGVWENEVLPSQPGGYAKSLMEGGRHGTGTEGDSELVPVFSVMGALALLILAAACGNLGSLLLARAVAREREMSIRTAVGAGRGRLIRQLFTESCLLAMMGSAAGLAAGYTALRAVLNYAEAPPWFRSAPDWRVVVFSLAIGFFSAILFGLAPALQLARRKHRATLFRQILLGVQIAASCVLLIVAGLLVRALHRAITADPGFRYQQVVALDPTLAAFGYSPARAQVYLDALQSRLRGLSGVSSVSLASTAPLGRRSSVLGLSLEGRPVAVNVNSVDPEFFQTMNIPLLRGRNLRKGDTHAAVISRSLASHWPGGDALGRQFAERTVVGIAGDAHITAMQNPDAMEAYFLPEPADAPLLVVLVRTSESPERLAQAAASIARSLDPKVFPAAETLKTAFQGKLQTPRRTALVVSILGGVALLLASLGIVGLVSYAVSQRTKEIGIRMALGAEPPHVLSVVLRQFSGPVVFGLAGGMAGAAALSQLLRGELYGLSGLDAATYLAAAAIFTATATLAALWPARRALRIDPLTALRYD